MHVCGGGLVMCHSYVSLRSQNCHSEMVKLENIFANVLTILNFSHHQTLMMTEVIGGNKISTFKLNLHYNYAGAS